MIQDAGMTCTDRYPGINSCTKCIVNSNEDIFACQQRECFCDAVNSVITEDDYNQGKRCIDVPEEMICKGNSDTGCFNIDIGKFR